MTILSAVAVLWTAILFLSPWALALTCEDFFAPAYLYNIRLLKNARNFRYEDFYTQMEGRLSWRLKYEGPEPSGKTQRITLSKSQNPVRDWQVTKFTHEGQNYLMLNVGMRQMRADIEASHELMRQVFESGTHDSVQFEASGEVQEARSTLVRYRWAAHTAVLDLYRKVKGNYLDEKELRRLELFNVSTENSDVYILLRDSGRDLKSISTEQIREDLLMTIQVAYTDHDLFPVPGASRLFIADSKRENVSPLPFQKRLKKNRIRISHLRKLMNSKWPAELTRYGLMQTVPSPVQTRFLYDVMQSATAGGADSFVASGDTHTSRLFSIFYGFTKIDQPIKTGQTTEPEYLSYLIGGSPTHIQVMQKLKKKSDAVSTEPASF